jgi:hypothetical protein
VIGTPSIFKLIREDVVLTRVLPTQVLPSTPKRTPRGGSGKVHCWFAEVEVLKLKRNGQKDWGRDWEKKREKIFS